MADIVTLDEVNDALNLGGDTSHDDELDLYIDAVTEHVAAAYGDMPSEGHTETLDTETVDETVRLVPRHRPVLAVTSATSTAAVELTTGFTVTPDMYIEHDDLTAGRWDVVYTSGYATAPADLKLAVLEDIRGLYQPGQVGPPAAFGAFGIDSLDVGVTYRPVRMFPRVDAWIDQRRFIDNRRLPGFGMILDQVIEALADLFDGAVAVDVYDGPDPTSANKGEFVLAGSTGEPDEDAAIITLEGSTLGAGTWSDEDGEVLCSSWSWSGGTDLAACRTAALANAQLCVAAVEADRTLGGLLVNPGLARVTELRYQPRQTAEGALCRVVFAVTYSHLNT